MRYGCILLLSVLAISLDGFAEPETKQAFEKLSSVEQLSDGMKFYFFTDDIKNESTGDYEQFVGSVSWSGTFSFKANSSGSKTELTLNKENGVWSVATVLSGTDYYLCCDEYMISSQYRATIAQRAASDEYDKIYLFDIDFNADHQAIITSENDAHPVFDIQWADGLNYYKPFFNPASAQIPVYIGNIVTRLKNAPVINVTGGWNVSATCDDGCEILYKLVPVESGELQSLNAPRKANGDEWKVWDNSDDATHPDLDEIMSDHYFVAKARTLDGSLESDEAQALVHSKILTDVSSEIASDTNEASTFYNLQGVRMNLSQLQQGHLYLRHSPTGTTEVIRY